MLLQLETYSSKKTQKYQPITILTFEMHRMWPPC